MCFCLQMLLLSLILVTTTLASPLTDDVLLEDEERLLNLDNSLKSDTKEREITYKSAGESCFEASLSCLDSNFLDHF